MNDQGDGAMSEPVESVQQGQDDLVAGEPGGATAARQPRRGAARPVLQLQSLAPRYDAAQHEVYVQALEDALGHSDTIHNIALTGPYGTGKSSVLAELARRHPGRVVQVSLSSVGEGGGAADAEAGSAVSPMTNRIQQEIVKQILYRDAPHRTRGSRFRRVSQLRLVTELPLVVAGAALLVVLLYLTGWGAPLVAAAGRDPQAMALAYGTVGVLVTGAALLVRWVTYGRLSLEKFTAGPATVSLTGRPDSYFDRYVDEIVYFFEKTGRDIVILEDLDRFRDVHIFQSLRALNTLLNTAEQVRRRRRVGRNRKARVPRVVFIYALRDSVFERLGTTADGELDEDEARQEVQLANRTKFFELVVPVVPFITHRNARDLMQRQMTGTAVGGRLISLAAQHVADQRLIINLRNEYDAYADRLLVREPRMPGLTADRLFAMLLYKSVHLGDFEQIRFRGSRLDALHDAWRALVTASIDRVTAEDAAAAVALTREGAAVRHAQELAVRLEEIVRARLQIPATQPYQVQIAGRPPQSSAAAATSTFWSEVLEAGQPLVFTANWNQSMQVSLQELPVLLGRPWRPELWLKVNRDRETRIRRDAAATLHFLGHHGWQQIYNRSEFTVRHGSDLPRTFAQMTGDLLESRLARDLVAAGFIDEYFALYVSMYYGEVVGAAALDFMVHALDRGQADLDYSLSAADVEAVLSERGEDVLRDPAIYNVSMLDHLLAAGAERVRVLLERLQDWGAAERRFTGRYLQRGADPVALVRALSFQVPDLIRFLLQDAPVEGQRRAELVDAALVAGDEADPLDEVDGFAAWVLDWYGQFPSLMDPSRGVDAGTAAVRLGVEGVVLPDVAGLNAASLRALAGSGGYAVTGANLAAVTGQSSLALDVLEQVNPSVQQRALQQLDAYLEAVSGAEGQVSVLAPDRFVAQLRAVDSATSADMNRAAAVVRLAAAGCRVDRLADAPPSAHRALLAGGRTAPTVENVLTYLEHSEPAGDVDALVEIEPVLADGPPWSIEAGLGQPDRVRLAVATLATSLPAHRRVAMVEALDLAEPLRVAQLHGRWGALAGALLERGLVVDDEDLFAVGVLPDWASREAAIVASSAFPALIGPAVLPPGQYGAFFDSTQIADAVKRRGLEVLGAYVEHVGPGSFEAAARWAVDSRTTLTAEGLDLLQRGGASPLAVVRLLEQAPNVDLDRVRGLLRAAGAPYSVVADPGLKFPLLPDDAAHRSLLDRLRVGDVVSGYRETDRGLRVSLRRPPA